MSSNINTEGVGKKIVEALKQQSDIDIIPVKNESGEQEISAIDNRPNEKGEELTIPQSAFDEINSESPLNPNYTSSGVIDNAFNQSMLNFKPAAQDINVAVVDDMDLPANVAVLRQLITKIPSGVSKQTGALIIKQTMEALGISMTNVLQEAQQVQESLTQSVKECQSNVLEYKKQISSLEVQAQKYQRQFAVINDIISLFIQTN